MQNWVDEIDHDRQTETELKSTADLVLAFLNPSRSYLAF